MNAISFYRASTIISFFSEKVKEFGNDYTQWFMGFTDLVNPENRVREIHNIHDDTLIARCTAYPEDVKIIFNEFRQKMKHQKPNFEKDNRINWIYIYKMSETTNS
ncbi:hypothetical protein KJ656_14420 [bacterium]|nr:hypothetical protein [bacterium]